MPSSRRWKNKLTVGEGAELKCWIRNTYRSFWAGSSFGWRLSSVWAFSLAGRRISEKNYALASRIALVVALAIAFVFTLFVGDVIAYF